MMSDCRCFTPFEQIITNRAFVSIIILFLPPSKSNQIGRRLFCFLAFFIRFRFGFHVQISIGQIRDVCLFALWLTLHFGYTIEIHDCGWRLKKKVKCLSDVQYLLHILFFCIVMSDARPFDDILFFSLFCKSINRLDRLLFYLFYSRAHRTFFPQNCIISSFKNSRKFNLNDQFDLNYQITILEIK